MFTILKKLYQREIHNETSPKALPETLNQSRTDNTRTKRNTQTMICKALHIQNKDLATRTQQQRKPCLIACTMEW